MNANEIIIPCRLSYANIWEPKQVNGTGDPKYSCCLLIPKSDTKTVQRLQAMIERDAYCYDILTQSAAVNAAMNAFNKEILARHIEGCVARDIREGKDEVIEELVTILQKLMK